MTQGDLISRQAVLDQLDQSINIIEAKDRIEALPSVQPDIEAIRQEIDKTYHDAVLNGNDEDERGLYLAREIIDKHLQKSQEGESE